MRPEDIPRRQERLILADATQKFERLLITASQPQAGDATTSYCLMSPRALAVSVRPNHCYQQQQTGNNDYRWDRIKPMNAKAEHSTAPLQCERQEI